MRPGLAIVSRGHARQGQGMRAVRGARELPGVDCAALGPNLGARQLAWFRGVLLELGTAGSGQNSGRSWEKGSGSGERVR